MDGIEPFRLLLSARNVNKFCIYCIELGMLPLT